TQLSIYGRNWRLQQNNDPKHRPELQDFIVQNRIKAMDGENANIMLGKELEECPNTETIENLQASFGNCSELVP
ncbi:1545_t:CDS:1, partial [Paraglomus occultum]